MPAPTTADELLDLLQKSKLLEEPRLRAYVQKQRDAAALPADPAKLAQFLVRDGLLTFFQADQLLQGKYKRFNLGKYKVLEKLGSGGMGTVFLCEHTLMRRRVAVKVLPFQKAEDDASFKRFLREARAAAMVDHPNIVRAYDIDQDDNLHFIVMEWVDGTNLQELIKKFGPLDPLRACHYIYGAAVGLQHAHDVGLLHRDIKPGNILIDRSGVVKILDLGLARVTNDVDDNLTRQNDENVLGTADYLAPEQALDSHTVDIRADIYSLGATFYFLLTGNPPFPDGSVAQKLLWHQNRAPRSVKQLRPEVPDEMVAAIEKMMAKAPADRYQTPAEVMTALSAWVSTPIPPPAEREMPTLAPAVAGERGARPAGAPSMVGIPGGIGALNRAVPPGPATFAGMPTAIATGSTPTPGPMTQTALPEAVWATLDGETRSGAPGDTDVPDPTARNKRAARAGAKTGKGKLLPGALVGAVLVAGTAAGVYFAFFDKKKDDPVVGGLNPGPQTGRKIIVSKTPGENTVPGLREALNKAAPGDTIVIAEPRIDFAAYQLNRARHKDVTIESGLPDGKPVLIEFFPHPTQKGGVMLDAREVEGLRLRNLEFDGKNQADRAVQISGLASGTTLEGVTVRGVQNAGIYLQNAAGDAARPIVLDRVRALLGPTGDGGIVMHASNADTKFVTIKNGRFEGPGKAGIRVDGPAQELEISNTRFFNLAAAVSFARPGGRVRFTNNTVFQAQVGLLLDVPAPPPPPPPPMPAPPPPAPLAYDLKVALNYFGATPAVLACPVPLTGLTVEHNLHDAASGLGQLPPTGAAKFDGPALPTPTLDHDAAFLRFPLNGFPTVGPNKARVGANPP